MTTQTVFTNNASTTLATALTTTATQLVVAAGTYNQFPTSLSSTVFYVTLQSVASGNIEIVQVTAVSTNTFTIVRAQQSTAAQAFVAGDIVELRITAGNAANWEAKVDTTALAASTGAGLIGTIAPGSGATTRTAQAAFSDFVSVAAYRQTSDTDDYLSFSRAIAALPTNGGTIQVPDAAYVLASTPTWGTKSIMWNIGVGATFSGAGTVGNGSFPRAVTNVSMYPVGPFIQSQSSTLSTANNATGAFVLEVLQPSGINGGSVGLYAAAQGGNSGTSSNIWAANLLVKSVSGATGGFWGVEIDVDSYASGATYFGIDVTGIGSVNPNYGVIIRRADSTFWGVGLEIRSASVGINLTGSSMSRGVVINTPATQANALISGKALANNSTMQFLQLYTDTSPTGYFQSFVNAANSAQLYTVDVLGNVAGNTLTAKGAASSTFSNALQLGGTTSNTATAGGQTLPANPVAFINAYIGSVAVKIPYYSA